jgi:two-component system, chemotaxis family, chemotaxis protein CheY
MSVDLSIPVLVVHDYPTMGSIVTNVLRQIGFAHIEGANGPKALRKLRDKAYGLVISDDAMAPMSGEELLRAIRARPDIAATPFLLLTTRKADRAAHRADVVTKPFNARTLHTKIAAVLQS